MFGFLKHGGERIGCKSVFFKSLIMNILCVIINHAFGPLEVELNTLLFVWFVGPNYERTRMYIT